MTTLKVFRNIFYFCIFLNNIMNFKSNLIYNIYIYIYIYITIDNNKYLL